jgi:hypothetical protein
MVQLVRGLLLESLVRGLNPYGGGLLLESLVSWVFEPHMSNHRPLGLRFRAPTQHSPQMYKQKPSDPHGTGHPGMGIISPIGQSPIVSTYPASYWQKGTHGGKTAQITERADKAWALAHADTSVHMAQLMRAAVGGA